MNNSRQKNIKSSINYRLIDTGWNKVLSDAIRADRSSVLLVCPFIKKHAVERLLENGIPKGLKVITRFNLRDFCDGVSDIVVK